MNVRCLLLIALVSWFGVAIAAEDEPVLQSVEVNTNDQEALQRGAQLFMNYCSGCHSLKYLRYSAMAQQLGLLNHQGMVDKELLFNNLIFTTAKVTDPIAIAMPLVDARQWFGVAPPDLTLETKVRGKNWVFSYLNSFYSDPARPFGSNNLFYPEVAMPNVLEPLQGKQIAIYKTRSFMLQGELHQQRYIDHLQLITHGSMTASQFRAAINDIVTFLAYAADPNSDTRESLGYWVIGFLLIFLVVVYLLKKSYWKDIK